MSVTRGQCDARATVTFPAARHHRPIVGTKLYCSVTEARVNNLPKVAIESRAAGRFQKNKNYPAKETKFS